MSLYDKMTCQECSHPRYTHAYNGNRPTGHCRRRGHKPDRSDWCRCPKFKEKDDASESGDVA